MNLFRVEVETSIIYYGCSWSGIQMRKDFLRLLKKNGEASNSSSGSVMLELDSAYCFWYISGSIEAGAATVSLVWCRLFGTSCAVMSYMLHMARCYAYGENCMRCFDSCNYCLYKSLKERARASKRKSSNLTVLRTVNNLIWRSMPLAPCTYD